MSCIPVSYSNNQINACYSGKPSTTTESKTRGNVMKKWPPAGIIRKLLQLETFVVDTEMLCYSKTFLMLQTMTSMFIIKMLDLCTFVVTSEPNPPAPKIPSPLVTAKMAEEVTSNKSPPQSNGSSMEHDEKRLPVKLNPVQKVDLKNNQKPDEVKQTEFDKIKLKKATKAVNVIVCTCAGVVHGSIY